MAKEIMTRRAADNTYLHRDFHGALSVGLDYIAGRFGEEAVVDYLRGFTRSYYAPVIADLRLRGLPALREHFERVYSIEGGVVTFSETADELVLFVEASPAVRHMREHGYHVSRYFVETVRAVNEALVEDSPFSAELVACDLETGRSEHRFLRRSA